MTYTVSMTRAARWTALARKSLADDAPPDVQRRGLMALARAYADAGLPAEALVHALDALARMTEAKDTEGKRACLLFLARLYERTERHPEAISLRAAAQLSV